MTCYFTINTHGLWSCLASLYDRPSARNWVSIRREGMVTFRPGLSLLGQTDLPRGNPESKVHGANTGPIWGRQDPGGPHVVHMNLAVRELMFYPGIIGGDNLSLLTSILHIIYQLKQEFSLVILNFKIGYHLPINITTNIQTIPPYLNTWLIMGINTEVYILEIWNIYHAVDKWGTHYSVC